MLPDVHQNLREENETLRCLLADLIYRQGTSPVAHFNVDRILANDRPEIEVTWDQAYRTITARVVQ